MKKILISAATLLLAQYSFAQQSPLTLSGYIETYYTYDFNKPSNNQRPGFIYSHNRHNEVNLNLAFIKANYQTEQLRANLAVALGTYMTANYAAEPDVMKNAYEANAGVKLSKTANLWLDAGVFSSHIGFESAISKDCWVLTRNIVSENTPYFETGAKLSYTTDNQKFSATLLYLNGWQRIKRADGQSKPAGGLQLNFKASDKITFNYSNYLGYEGQNAVRTQRFYHNLYGVFQLSNQFGVTAGIDYGTQQIAKGSSEKKEVLAPVIIARYAFSPTWALAGRYEYYKDKQAMIITGTHPDGFKVNGYSLNIDYSPFKQALLRLEGKVYQGDQQFIRNNNPVDYNASITTSLAISF
ncbi:porin [Pedobacter nanyangensis]|uniref:porin n=1 Tax=Pedobacter nanyangensis TaxID=1562389 RepID=UPI000DE2DB13|nr:porin [Pedobacter nanyangensis]